MLKLVFWIIVLVLALSFFGISLRSIIESPAGQQNFNYLWQLIQAGWDMVKDLFSFFPRLNFSF